MLMLVFKAIIPLFIMVFAGSFSFRKQILPANAGAVLNDFVYYFTLPTLIFYSLVTTPFEEVLNIPFIGGFTVSMLIIYVLMYFTSKLLLAGTWQQNIIRGCGSCFPNSAYLGLPIVLSLFADSKQAMIYTTLSILLPIIIVAVVIGSFSINGSQGQANRWEIIKKTTWSMIKTPFLLAGFVGGILSYCGILLPEFALKGLKSFGMASIPCALFAVGIMLCENRVKLKLREIISVNLFKLAIQPIVGLVCYYLFGIRGENLLISVILSGMPMAAVACVFASVYKTCEGETCANVMISMIVYPLFLWIILLLGQQAGYI